MVADRAACSLAWPAARLGGLRQRQPRWRWRQFQAAAVAGAVAGAGARYSQAGAHCRQAGAMAEAVAEAVTLSATIFYSKSLMTHSEPHRSRTQRT